MHVLWHATGGRGVLEMFGRRLDVLKAKRDWTSIVICWDRPSFRKGLDQAYKAGRKPTDPKLAGLLREAEQTIWPGCERAAQEGFEADDCLATLAETVRIGDGQAVLASADKDLRQSLVPGRITLLRNFRVAGGELQDPDWYTAETLGHEYGLKPQQWPEYQLLAGDSGDGVAGVPGWGPKTAAKALQICGSVATMIADPWKMPVSAKQRDAFLRFKPRIELTRAMVTLRLDVEAVWDALR
jgi:DNA polymerase-1